MRGTTVAGRYRLVDILGSGGMGEVWRAADLNEGHDIAIKIITLGPGDAVREAAFRREAGVAARLTHPNVVAVHDHGATDLDGRRALFLTMDLIEGPPLSARITGPQSLTDTLTWAAQISQALHAAHQAGIVHRDIKPSNILIDRHGAAVLCDFGIARLADLTSHHTLTVTGAVIGTPAYMSPEQARGDKDLAAPSDLYSLGCLIHELLTGSAPFDGTGWNLLHQHLHATPVALSTLRRDVPRELEQLVLELLHKEPAGRPTAAEALERLSRLHSARAAFAAAPTTTPTRRAPEPTVPDTPTAAPRSHGTGTRATALWAGAVTGSAIAGELAWATPMPNPWPVTLGVLAGLLLSALYLLDTPEHAQPEELEISTAGLFTMLLITLGMSVALLVSAMWWAALATAMLGGPVLIGCSTAVRQTVAHVLHRPTRHADLASTAGALHTVTLLLAAGHADFSALAILTSGLALWPVTALITGLITSRGTPKHHAQSSRRPAIHPAQPATRAKTVLDRT
ncbi:serine/threonine-protein kinase [Streptomyces sp. NPDC051555]|uniref:serine/threonine-protein kinase n=1 Tax=Streptomyces sp. NPDC051555 TaxID=3365657 RepID=UPI00378DD021